MSSFCFFSLSKNTWYYLVIPGIAAVQDVLKVLFEVKLGVKCDA